MGSSRVIAISVGLKPYIQRVHRDGAPQRAFTAEIGKPVGGCVRSGVREGMGSGEIKNVVRKCAKQVAGKTYSVAGYAKARKNRRVAATAGEYYEIN